MGKEFGCAQILVSNVMYQFWYNGRENISVYTPVPVGQGHHNVE